MKRIDIIKKKKFDFIKISQPPHFIGSWNIENNELCKEIINYFEENKSLQKAGVTQNGKNPTVKKTIDIRVTPNELKNIELKCLHNYINEFLVQKYINPICNTLATYTISWVNLHASSIFLNRYVTLEVEFLGT